MTFKLFNRNRLLTDFPCRYDFNKQVEIGHFFEFLFYKDIIIVKFQSFKPKISNGCC